MNIYQNWELGKTYCSKDTKNSGTVSFGIVSKSITKEMMIKEHYSKTFASYFGKVNIGIFKNEKLMGVASFGTLMNSHSFKKLIDTDDFDAVLELNRLWISDDLGKNSETILLAVAMKYLKHSHPEVKVIQSFADGRLGCGTIYKAANFKYYGFHTTKFLELTDGTVQHKILFENTRSATKFLQLNTAFLKNQAKFFEVKTYRYIYILDKRTKVLLKEKPYPIYEKGSKYIEHIPSCNQIHKVRYLLAKKNESTNFVDEYLEKTYTKEQNIASNLNVIRYFNEH